MIKLARADRSAADDAANQAAARRRALLKVGDAGPADAPVKVVHGLALQALQLVLQEVKVPHVHAKLLLGVRGVVLALLRRQVVAGPEQQSYTVWPRSLVQI